MLLPSDAITEAISVAWKHMSKNGSASGDTKTKTRRASVPLKEQQAELLAFCLGDYMVV